MALPFNFSLDWMWLADPGDLRDRLGQTLWYFHAFPPGMDLLTGLLLKATSQGAATAAYCLFLLLGLVLANAMLAVARAAGLSTRAAIITTVAFLLSPPAIFFEYLYLYEWPVVTLLVVSAVAFHRATAQPILARWAIFFGVASLIAVTRSTFHLMWFAVLVAGAVLAGGIPARRAALIGAVPGLLLILMVYGKNEWLFGEFAASTFGPASMHLVTVDRMPRAERERWMAEGRLSPFASISPYAPPRDYSRFFPGTDLPGWPPQVTRLERDHVAAPNFNHWFLLEAHRARRRDVESYLRAHPLGYLANVWTGLVRLLGPSTEWHPRTGTPASPHAGHRRVLGAYEGAYNYVLHWLVAPPAGLYVLLPLVLAWSAWQAVSHLRSGEPAARARGALIGYCTFQIVFVTIVSSMATFLESSRYRFQVEPFIWVLVTLLVVSLLPHGRLPDRRHV
jgi:hypothetical protein